MTDRVAKRVREAIWLVAAGGLAISGVAQIRTPDEPGVQQDGSWPGSGEQVPGQQADPDDHRSPASTGAALDQPPRVDPASGPLVIPSGTYLSVRLDQLLSSDGSDSGDEFSATLARPLVVEGLVVARRGQTVIGRVLEAHRGGRTDGPPRLVLELMQLTTAGGAQVPVRSDLIARASTRSTGKEAGMIAGAAATGAAIGAMVNGGVGAGIGAIVGGAAGTAGVLVVRGRTVILYPETQIAFRLEEDVRVDTSRSPQAFRPAERSDYELQPRPHGRCGGYPCPPPPPYGPPGPGPYYWFGPSASVYMGGGYWR